MNQSLNILMKEMPEECRYRWCEAKLCCCLGCCNKAFGLLKAGVTKQIWEQWVKENPKRRQKMDTNKKDILHKFIRDLKINIFEQDAVASIGGIYLEDFDKEDLVLLSNALLIKSMIK